MFSRIKKLILLLETRPVSVSGAVFTFLAIVLARHLLEILAAQNPVYFPIQFFLHYPLAYLAPFLALVLVLNFFSGVDLSRVARLMLHVWTLTLLPPLLDLLLGRSGEAIGYLRLGDQAPVQVLIHFLDPRASFSGTTPGIRMETALACFLGGAYVCLRRLPARLGVMGLLPQAAGAAAGVYLTALGFFTLPRLMAGALAPLLPNGDAASLLLPPRYLVIPQPLDVLVADHVSLLYLVPLCLFLGALCLHRTATGLLTRMFRRYSPADSLQAASLTAAGILWGAMVKERLEGRIPAPVPVDILAALGLVAAAALLPWAVELLLRPTVGAWPALTLLSAALAMAVTCGAPAASLLSIGLALTWVRKAPPLEADRIWLAGPLCTGIAHLAILGSGVAWAVQTNALAVLPPRLVTAVFLAGTLAALSAQFQTWRAASPWSARAAAWLPTLAGLGAVTILPLGAGASLMVAGICAATWMAAAIPRLTGRPLSGLEKTARLGAMLLALAGILGPAQARQPLLKAATQRPKLMVRQGMAQEAKNDLAAAIRWYRKALELAPRQARVQARLGELLRLEGHEAAARSAYEAALELDPTLLITRQQLALLLLDSGEPGEAARRLQAAGREALNEPAVASTLAEALSRIPSRTTEAVAAWRHYLEISRGIEGQKPRRSHARSRLRELQRKAP